MACLRVDQLPDWLHKAIARRSLTAGEILFRQGDPTREIFLVETGQIKLFQYTEAGQTINHYTVKPGELCAEVVLFIDSYICTAIADIPTQLIVFPKSSFLTALQQAPHLSTTFTAGLARRFHELKMLLELRSIRSARERVLRYLQLNAPPNDTTVNLSRPFKDIADDLGISPEALSRALAQLEKQGAIARMKRKITLHE